MLCASHPSRLLLHPLAPAGSDDGSGNDEDAQGDEGDEAADVAEGYGSSSRQERIQLALMLHKEACVKALGQDTFLQL